MRKSTNHIFKSLDEVEATLCKALMELDAEPERLRKTNERLHI